MKKGDSERDPASGESFLQRWSREKARARAEADSASPAADAQVTPAAGNGAADEGGQVEPVELPSIEDLGPDSDYSAFMSPEVDAGLRRLALRKLFRSPKFNVLDGMDDYCEDFTKFPPLGGIVTADMRHQLERVAREAMSRLEKEVEPVEPDAVAPSGLARESNMPAAEGPETDADEKPA